MGLIYYTQMDESHAMQWNEMTKCINLCVIQHAMQNNPIKVSLKAM